MARIAAIVLAAGRASRFGAADDDSKVVAPLHGKPLLAHVVAAAVASRATPVIVVIGHAAAKATAALDGINSVVVVRNPDHASGLARSLQVGLGALPVDVDGALILLGDMPLVSSVTLDRLVDAFTSTKPDAVAPVHDGCRGNPVLLGRSLFSAAMTLTGDMGARLLLADPRYRTVDCPVDDPGVLVDIDTREALATIASSRAG